MRVNIFGSYQDPNGEYAAVILRFIDLGLDGNQPIIFGDGEQFRDFTYIDNAVQANILTAEGDVTDKAFIVACGGRVTINDLVSHLNQEPGTVIEPQYDSPRPGDVPHSHADISKANKLLGYEPAVGFREGLKRTIEYYKST